MLVKAAAGIKVPKEFEPRKYIDDQLAVEVPDSSVYYQKQLLDGDLAIVTSSTAASAEVAHG